MNAQFLHGPDLITSSRNGGDFLLWLDKDFVVSWAPADQPIKLVHYRMLGNGVTKSDGASIPKLFASFGLDRYGVYWPAAFAHDACFRKTLMVWDEATSTWINANLSEAKSNYIISMLMFSVGVDEGERKIIYDALVLFGKAAYDEDAKLAAA